MAGFLLLVSLVVTNVRIGRSGMWHGRRRREEGGGSITKDYCRTNLTFPMQMVYLEKGANMKKLRQYGIWFYGPHSPQLFELVYTRPPAIFTDVFIGSGESKAVAAMRALSHMKGAGWSGVFPQLEKIVMDSLPFHSTAIEGDDSCAVYCVLALEGENV